ncbi:hypothetical protein ACN47E_002528 [Coniothyrium glycines]
MITSLDQLPFDILFCVANNLDIEDIVHLGQSCRQLHALLDERTLCHRIVEDKYSYTDECHSARSEKTTYKQAFFAIYDRRRAFSTVNPFSARSLGQGQAFLCRQNIVCIQEGSLLRVFDLILQSIIASVDLLKLIQPVLGKRSVPWQIVEFSLLNYSDGIIAIHVTSQDSQDNGFVCAILVVDRLEDSDRLIAFFRPVSVSKIFVRHNARYLYYGTHSGIGDDGHRKWEINGVAFYKDFPLPEKDRAILLEDFHGTDIGATVAFEIHGNYFYAVSNQGTCEVEEIDYTSFYHWVRFPVDDPILAKLEKDDRLFRRQHKQGPIHDSWTDLTLQMDERTNEIVIVESRREWAQASSRQSRTFYTTKLETPSAEEPTLPEDDPYFHLIDSSNNAHWKPTPDLYSWSQHPEFSKDDPNPRSFILARTKFRGYNYSCTSFLDLVEDNQCCSTSSPTPLCLRLRIGSRREVVPQGAIRAPTAKGKQRSDSTTSPPFVDTQTLYRHSPIHLWPPPAATCPCSARLHNILNPPLGTGAAAHTRSITGVLDARRLVYMITPGHTYGARSSENTLGAIVLVDFTRPPRGQASEVAAPTAGPLAQSNDTAAGGSGGAWARDNSNTSTGSADGGALSWHWTPGQQKRCRERTCR